MGRVKSLMVKKAARELYETVPDFSDEFEKNKKLLKNTMSSKSVRNKVAGSIVRLARKKQLKHDRKIKEERSDEQYDA